MLMCKIYQSYLLIDQFSCKVVLSEIGSLPTQLGGMRVHLLGLRTFYKFVQVTPLGCVLLHTGGCHQGIVLTVMICYRSYHSLLGQEVGGPNNRSLGPPDRTLDLILWLPSKTTRYLGSLRGYHNSLMASHPRDSPVAQW